MIKHVTFARYEINGVLHITLVRIAFYTVKQLRIVTIPHGRNGYVTSGSANSVSKFQRAIILFGNMFPEQSRIIVS